MSKSEKAPGGLGTREYWSLHLTELLNRLEATADGLSADEAASRLKTYGPNQILEENRHTRLEVLWHQLQSPILLLLVFAAIASIASGELIDAAIVLVIVSATVAIGYSREYRAHTAAAALRNRVQTQTNVLRNGGAVSVPLREVVPGDITQLSAGSIVPADSIILEATDFFVNEAVLTGESFPVQKQAGALPASAPLSQRKNCVFFGTNVGSGTARCIIVRTGMQTELGGIAHRLTLSRPETEFDRGIRHFGYLLAGVMLIMVVIVFGANILLGRPVAETLLFSIALAVGLSPELLPAILSLNLARGAQLMANHGVLVKSLNAIENLGSMDILCTDKTGTLTEGVVRLENAYDESGQPSVLVRELAARNAALQTGLTNPLDQAILRTEKPNLINVEKLGEVPYDFVRKRLSVVVREGSEICLITKGALEPVLQNCVRCFDGAALDEERLKTIRERFELWSSEGKRTLAVATRTLTKKESYGREDECDLTFQGFITFLDRPKEGVSETIQQLKDLGVSIKVITGDAKLVAQYIASAVGLRPDRVLTGTYLHEMSDDALIHAAENTDLFVEVDPNQKERIILSLKKMGHVVGFMGDGVNDAPAMHAADTSISVEEAVDVAKEAADFVLLDRHLDVVRRGIEEGRRTFANTLKYILMTTSANLGNMVSMAVASFFLPFLPLTAGQILLNNFISDIPAVGIADDSVDPEMVARPERWNIRFIKKYMIEFGLLSSVFDCLTFVVFLRFFSESIAMFRTGWFVESLLSELVIALVVRTRRPFFRSRPGSVLLYSTLILVAFTPIIPYLPYSDLFGFVPLPANMLYSIGTIIVFYVFFAELAKARFYRLAAIFSPTSQTVR